MDNSLLLGLLGIVFTLIVGVPSFIDYIKRRRYPGRITYIQLKSVNLLNKIADQFDDVSLTHKDKKIDSNLVYVKGALLNNGSIDINKQRETNVI